MAHRQTWERNYRSLGLPRPGRQEPILPYPCVHRLAGKSSEHIFQLLVGCLLAVTLFAVYHLWLVHQMLHTGLKLGMVGPGTNVNRLVPLYMYWQVHWKPTLLISLGMCLLFGSWFHRADRLCSSRENVPACRLVMSLMLFHVAVACSVAMIDGGITRLWRPYAAMAGSDYIGAVPKITTPAAFLAQYVELLPKLPLHCRTHPPGGPLFLWGVEQAWGAGPAPAALATILGGTLAIPAVWGLARLVLGRRRALWATALFVWSPCIVLFTATCMDIVFSVPMIWSFYLMWRGRQSQPIRCGVAAGLSASLAAMFTFSAGFLAIWAIVAFFLTALFDRPRLRNTLIAWCAAAATAMVFYTTLYALTGYHLLETLAACTPSHFQIMDGGNHAVCRQYGHLVFANLVAFFFSVGVPLAVLWIRRTSADLRDMLHAKQETRDSGWLLGLSFLAALLILDLAPVHTLEVEHIWLYMVPLVVIGAVRGLTTKNATADRRVVLAALGLLMLQTIAIEVLFTTLW